MRPDQLTGRERARYVQNMFSRIAQRYDLMNRLMTFGQDVFWRKEVIRRAGLNPENHLLDLGSGTGDLAVEALHQQPKVRAVAGDFTLEMMRVGQQRRLAAGLTGPDWCGADALNLPFPGSVFDAVISGYLMRNVSDISLALSEQYRVLKPGGRLVILDTTRPKPSLLTPLINLHLHVVIPVLGRWLTGEADAYNYLPDSTEGFLTAEQMADRMVKAGFSQVGFKRFNFGTMVIHWGIRI